VSYHIKLQNIRQIALQTMILCGAFFCIFSVVQVANAKDAPARAAAESPSTHRMGRGDGPELLPFVTNFPVEQWAGEEVHYSISMMGGEAARAAMHIGEVIDDEELGRVAPVQGLISSVGFLSALVKFKYGGMTYIDLETGYPVWSEKLLEDGGRTRTYTSYYARDEYRADVVRNENDRDSPRKKMIPRHSDDIFTWLLRLREMDLEVGETYVAYIFDGWLVRRLTLRVLSHAERPVRAGARETVKAAEIAIQTESLEPLAPLPWAPKGVLLPPVYHVIKREQVASMWFSLDDRRVPLNISLQTPVGFVRMELTKYVAPSRDRR